MKYLVIILLAFNAFATKAQLPWNTTPTQFSTGYFRQGWHRADSGHILANRAPNFTPRYAGSIFLYPEAGIDTSIFYWTGGRFIKLIPGFDSTSLSNRINLKLNISDTSNMLLPYLRKADTTNKWVQDVYVRNDSLFKFKNGAETFLDTLGSGGASGTVTSVALSMPSAFSVTGSPITTSGTFNISGAGTTTQYIRGNGTLATTDTGMIPNFYLKVRGLFSGTSPITYNTTIGAIGINNANTSGTKGAATFNNSDFSDNGSGTISLSTLGSAGSCTGCILNIDTKGRITGYSDGPSGATNNTNIGAGFRILNATTQEIRTLFAGFGTRLDSITNTDGLTWSSDTTRSSGLPSYYYVDSLFGRARNISNAALTADGDYAQNWNNKQWYVDSIAGSFLFRTGGIGSTGTLRKGFRINWGGSGFANNFDSYNIMDYINKADNSGDSLQLGMVSSGGVLSLGSYDATASVRNTFISYGSTTGLINISARDSIWIKGAVPAATADSVLGLVHRAGGVSKIVKIPTPTGGSGITELTGDVTAGPGSGSQAATIVSNAVTNTKFRQSVGVSVVGRSANSTGNVADIVSTVASTYLKRGASTILWDSVDWAEIKNTPQVQNPGVYFSPAESFDPSFVVFASGIPRTTTPYVQGTPMLWEFLDNVTDHNSSFFDSVSGSGSGIGVRFPTVRNVLNTTITCDETFASKLIFTGTSTALNGAGGPVLQPAMLNIRLTGQGTSSWAVANGLGLTSHFSLSTISAGGTSFNVNAIGTEVSIDYESLNIVYIGKNNYHIRRIYSGLGIYNVRFVLVDQFGNDITTDPTSDDEVVISSSAMTPVILDMGTWQPNTQFIDGFANFWIFGAYECWEVAAPTSSTSILVRYQTIYPSATNYKIYRSTSLYGAETLVHTGTDGSFTDSGLTPGTLYWYKMYAVIGGVDTYITYFRTSTNN